jgi:chlorite dismutase
MNIWRGLILVAASCLLISPDVSHGAIMDAAKVLSDTGVYGTYAVFRIDKAWYRLPKESREQGVAEAKAAIQRHAERVLAETYLLRGLTDNADFLLRLHAYDLISNQNLLADLMATGFGRYLENTQTLIGLTKPLNYLPKLADLHARVKGAQLDPGPKPYAVVIPIRKDAAWWTGSDEARLAMMKEHTEATLGYLKTVKRKLYHSTGLDDWDFITYFETARPEDFHQLVLQLMQIAENRHNERFGNPIILGTARSLDELFALLQ